ncbi:MAG TPA: CDP-glycerol glycerophosphotransferase family protein [Chitinophagaceae bacterium]
MSFFSEYTQVSKLLQQKQQVVFYAESRHYYPYFEKLINDLSREGIEICYITSDADDGLLRQSLPNMKVVYVKWMLGFLFSRIKADVMIMTMTDLDNYLFKRSPAVGSYIYIFHAAVSTHQQYRQEAFYHYDCIFCVGEYQQTEIRTTEKLNDLPQKELMAYGYPLFDEIEKKTAGRNTGTKNILIAPSWFDGCIFDVCLEELLQQLSALPYKIILRSHPEYEKRKRKEFKRIKKDIAAYFNVVIDDMPNILDRLTTIDMLITDRSGIALEFAFGAGKPVLFIDTSLKQTNPDWKNLQIEPVENSLRKEIGVSVPVNLDGLQPALKTLEELSSGFEERVTELKRTLFYNSDENYKKGLEYVLQKIKRN